MRCCPIGRRDDNATSVMGIRGAVYPIPNRQKSVEASNEGRVSMEEMRHTLNNTGSIDPAKLKKLIRPLVNVEQVQTSLTVRF